MLNLNSILIGSDNPKQLADFYKQVFQKEPDWSGKGWSGFSVGSGWLSIGPHDKVHGQSTNPERIIFNFETKDVKGEFERIRNLKAKVIAEPYEPEQGKNMWIATFADPDENYFQLMPPWK